jgi:hypothetical protein
MGNSKKGSAVDEKFVFTGVQQDFKQFRTLMHINFEDKDQQWFSLLAQAIVKIYHIIVAERTVNNATTPLQADLNKFWGKKIANVQETMNQNGVIVTLDLDLVKTKKDVIGSTWVEHDKLKITEEELKTWHESIDQSYLVKINRSVLKIMHNSIYPTDKENTDKPKTSTHR